MSIPADKIERAKYLISEIVGSRKTTVHKMQKLCGFLNFIGKAVVPGRAFTRRLYSYFSSSMKPHFHINVKAEMKLDLKVWELFLSNPLSYCRPFMDFSTILMANDLDWYTDASGKIGYGGYHFDEYFQGTWDDALFGSDFEGKVNELGIQCKEMYVVLISIYIWGDRYRNRRIRLFCDNKNVVNMLNTGSSSCIICMKMVRILTLKCMQWNLRVFGKFVSTNDNFLADALSRFQMERFWKDIVDLEKNMSIEPRQLPTDIWPINKIL